MTTDRPPTAAPPPLSAALAAELDALAPAPPRRPGRQLAVLVGASAVYAAALVALLAVRRDLAELPTAWVLGAGATWLCGFLVPAYLALVPAPGAVMPRATAAIAAAVTGAIGFVALGLALHPSGPSSLDYGWAHFERGHTCLEIGLATALVPVVGGALCLRGALPVRSRAVAAALGAAGGGLGGLVLHLHCCVADWHHVALVHGGVVGAAAALSAAIAPRVTDRVLDSAPPRH